jgi:hypothetical protein
MASVAQICNMALSHIGSDARVSSISPPDGSVEAGHCATFYDQARTELLEPGNWAFSLKRQALAEIPNVSTAWAHAYTKPSDCLAPKRVLRAGTTLTVFTQDDAEFNPNDQSGADYDIEGDVLYTNKPDAVLVYVRDVTDTTKFTASFNASLSYLLGAYVAGPIVKGNEGLKLGDAMRQRAMALADISSTASANASQSEHAFMASQLVARA